MRINAGNKDATNAQDKAIADGYGNKFIIPLDFEMLDSAAPYYQAGLGNRLCYELTFSDYNRVTKSTVSSPKVPDAKYKITDISLEYEIATQPDLARSIRSEYQHMALLYDRILRHRKIIVKTRGSAVRTVCPVDVCGLLYVICRKHLFGCEDEALFTRKLKLNL